MRAMADFQVDSVTPRRIMVDVGRPQDRGCGFISQGTKAK